MTDAENPPEYIIEYVDGPLAGRTDRRLLLGGERDEKLSAEVLVQGIETTFWYIAGESRHVQNLLHVKYYFDQPDSDPVSEDRLDVSGKLSDPI